MRGRTEGRGERLSCYFIIFLSFTILIKLRNVPQRLVSNSTALGVVEEEEHKM